MKAVYRDRFGRQALAGLEAVEADLAENGLANTRPLTPSLRVAATESVVFVIDPAWIDERLIVVLTIGRQPTNAGEAIPPTHFAD